MAQGPVRSDGADEERDRGEEHREPRPTKATAEAPETEHRGRPGRALRRSLQESGGSLPGVADGSCPNSTMLGRRTAAASIAPRAEHNRTASARIQAQPSPERLSSSHLRVAAWLSRCLRLAVALAGQPRKTRFSLRAGQQTTAFTTYTA